MKIVQEIFDKEYYVDQILSQQDFDALRDYMVLSFPCSIDGKKVNLGLKVELYDDVDDLEG